MKKIINKILIPVMIVLLVNFLLSIIFILIQERKSQYDAMNSKCNSLVSLLAKISPNYYATYDYEALESFTVEAEKDNSIVYALFRNKDKEIITSKNKYVTNSSIVTFSREIKKGDQLFGSIEIGYSTRNIQSQIRSQSIKLSLILIVAMILIMVGIFLTVRPVIKNINAVKNIFSSIAGGDLTKSEGIQIISQDEIGEMLKWFNTFIINIKSILKELINKSNSLNSTYEDLSVLSSELIVNVDDMNNKSQVTSSSIQQMNNNIDTAEVSADKSNSSITKVASAAQQLASTINTIAENAEKASNISSEAVTNVKNASEKVNSLGANANEIGNIINTVTELAEQTNLLSLNATIEAASAGEAGKGFAVVANEVKELARQTNEAIDDIKNKVSSMQHSVTLSIDEINKIETVITEVSDYISSIAISLDEQNMATKNIAINIDQASVSIKSMSNSVIQTADKSKVVVENNTSMNHFISGVSTISSRINDTSSHIHDMGNELKKIVRAFKI